jgi:hypothetical protein
MKFSWFKRPKVHVEAATAWITVTMPGSKFKVVYHLTNGQLIASSFKSDRLEQKGGMTFPNFLSLAWEAANTKARELGWIK